MASTIRLQWRPRHTFWAVLTLIVVIIVGYRQWARLAPPKTLPAPSNPSDGRVNPDRNRASSTPPRNNANLDPDDGDETVMDLSAKTVYPPLESMLGPCDTLGIAPPTVLPNDLLGIMVKRDGVPTLVRLAGVTLAGVGTHQPARDFIEEFCRLHSLVWLLVEPQADTDPADAPVAAFVCAKPKPGDPANVPYWVLNEQLIGQGWALKDDRLRQTSPFRLALEALQWQAMTDQDGLWKTGQMPAANRPGSR